ncbi:50S ribosomal protein L7ae [Candidatus Woesearchaeota archaeon]|nr:50S ribosomal protein L7ae [Candidatus Woesearchaeota archaeon]
MAGENEKVFEAIELAKTTGKIKKGTNEVTKAIEKGTAKLVVIAKDISPPEITMHIPLLCKEKGISCVEVGSKEELGAAAGLDVPTGAVAIVQEGEAKKVMKEFVKDAPAKEEAAPEEKKEEEPKEKKHKKEKKE